MCRLLKKCVELTEVVYYGGGDGLVHLLVAPADTSVPYCLATGSAGGKDVLGEAVTDDNHILCGDAESRHAELEDAGIWLADTDDGRLDDMAEIVAEAEVCEDCLYVAVEIAYEAEGVAVGKMRDDGAAHIKDTQDIVVAIAGHGAGGRGGCLGGETAGHTPRRGGGRARRGGRSSKGGGRNSGGGWLPPAFFLKVGELDVGLDAEEVEHGVLGLN